MGMLLFKADCDSKLYRSVQKELAAPLKEFKKKDKQSLAFINDKRSQRSLYIELDVI